MEEEERESLSISLLPSASITLRRGKASRCAAARIPSFAPPCHHQLPSSSSRRTNWCRRRPACSPVAKRHMYTEGRKGKAALSHPRPASAPHPAASNRSGGTEHARGRPGARLANLKEAHCSGGWGRGAVRRRQSWRKRPTFRSQARHHRRPRRSAFRQARDSVEGCSGWQRWRPRPVAALRKRTGERAPRR